MELGLSLPIRATRENQREFVKYAEKIGCNHIWIGDNPPLNNALNDIEQLITSTSRLSFWTGITSPFYYHPSILYTLSRELFTKYSNRFGLGLGIGNIALLQNKPTNVFHEFCENFLALKKRIKYNESNEYSPSFPLALGGLGDKMISFAAKHADSLLLNSASLADIQRSHRLLKNSNCKLYIYGMFQFSENEEALPVPLIERIVSDIVKGCSKKILNEHSYSMSEINLIKSSDQPLRDVNEELKYKILNDFAIYGTYDENLEKLCKIKSVQSTYAIDGIILGWANSKKEWGRMEKIVEILKKK